MDFAPYQDQAPEQSRALSPPPQGRPQSPRSTSQRDPFVQQAAPQHQAYRANQRSYEEDYNNEDDDEEVSYQAGGLGQTGTGARADPESGRGLDLFATSLPLRMDYEAMLAYLLLPPAGGVLLLILEHRSDYVRFHAWQSALLFSAAFILHLIFSFNSVLSWLLFVADVLAIGLLSLRAYRDADTLDRFEVPFFGRLASSFVDDE